MNLLDEEHLDPAAEPAVREQLAALASPDVEDEDQQRQWTKIKRLAPSLWERSGAREIITTLVLAEAGVRLGLPPP